MWKTYQVEQQFTTPFASSTPKNPKDIEAMLSSRAPSKPPEDAIPLPELAEEVAGEVEATEEVERGYATFKRDDKGLYYEARCVRAHIKDCANILRKRLAIPAFKAKVANRVYVEPAKIRVLRGGKAIQEPDGSEIRIVHALTPKGPRSSLKTIDYVDSPKLQFQLKVLDDGVITQGMLESIFEYGGQHGEGQERSQDWGKYVFKLEEVK